MLRLPKILLFAFAIFSIGLFSCSDDETPDPGLEIPDTYLFDNVDYSGQTQRLAMLLEIKNYMLPSRVTGNTLDETKLLAMYENDAANAGWKGNYDALKMLKGKTFESEQDDFEDLLKAVAAASKSQVAGSEGQAGVVFSNDNSKQYLLGPEGLDHAQLIEKGLMAACFYYQATSVYMGAERMSADNEAVTPGRGTDMEHHWDEAFGYFGVPRSFPVVTDGAVFWGNYSVQRDGLLGSNEKLMDALIKGRAAISAKDLAMRDEAIAEAREQWELIAAGSALHYLNETLASFDDMAIRGHALSEGIGFVYALKFNEARKINLAQIDELLTLMGGGAKFDVMNLYQVDAADLQEAKDKLAAYYGLEDIKDDF